MLWCDGSISYSRHTSKKCSLIALRKETHLISRCLNQMRRTPILVGRMGLHTVQLSSYSQISARTSIHSGQHPQTWRGKRLTWHSDTPGHCLDFITGFILPLLYKQFLFLSGFSLLQACPDSMCFDPPSGKTVPCLASVPFVLSCLTNALRIDICHKNTHIVLSM